MKRLLLSSFVFLCFVFSVSVIYAAGPGAGAPSPGFSGSSRGPAAPGYGAPPGGYKGGPHPSNKGYQGTRSVTGSGSVKGDRGAIVRQKGPPEDQDAQEIQGTQSEECRPFLNETASLRKEFATKRLAYFKAREDQKANTEDIENQRNEIQGFIRDIESKNTQNCRWIY